MYVIRFCLKMESTGLDFAYGLPEKTNRKIGYVREMIYQYPTARPSLVVHLLDFFNIMVNLRNGLILNYAL